jgi:GxxExxY protein
MWQHETLTGVIIECIIAVHSELGPGYRADVYRNALTIELNRHDLKCYTEFEIPVRYDGHVVGRHFLDILVEKLVVVDVQAVDFLGSRHYAQVRSYLKAGSFPAGILVNMSEDRADFRRVNGRTP